MLSTDPKGVYIGEAAYKADVLKNVTFPCQISNKMWINIIEYKIYLKTKEWIQNFEFPSQRRRSLCYGQ